MGKRKRTNNDFQHIAQKTKDRATRTPPGELRCSERADSSCSSTCGNPSCTQRTIQTKIKNGTELVFNLDNFNDGYSKKGMKLSKG